MASIRWQFGRTFSKDRGDWIRQRRLEGSVESENDLTIRYVCLIRRRPVSEAIHVVKTEDNNVVYAKMTFHLTDNQTEHSNSYVCTVGHCTASIILSKFSMVGNNLALLGHTEHTHYQPNDVVYASSGNAVVLQELMEAFRNIERDKGGVNRNLSFLFEEDDHTTCLTADPVLINAYRTFDRYRQYYKRALLLFKKLGTKNSTVYGYFHSSCGLNSSWQDRSRKPVYIGQRATAAITRTNTERNTGRWKLHVMNAEGWVFYGMEFGVELSKDAADYFENNILWLFGDDVEGRRRMSNQQKSLRFNKPSLGDLESDLIATSFFFLRGIYNNDYYRVDMRPKHRGGQSSHVDRVKLLEWRIEINVDGLVADFCKCKEENRELRQKLEQLNRKNAALNRLLKQPTKVQPTPLSAVTMVSTMPKKVFSFHQKDRSIDCVVHSAIHVYEPISSIIDTPQFQRLRRIKQLGAVYLVYPCANHSLFEHSLGTYHVSLMYARKLLEFYPEKLNARDVLCVAIAGLIHDLGHGPLSHTFDGEFMKSHNEKREKRGLPAWKHEQASVDMWKYLLETNPDTHKRLDEYLAPEDYIFIEELIRPPKDFIENGTWILKGRGIEKSFLYAIVSNQNEAFDADKVDCLLRDAHQATVPIAFTTTSLNRLLEHIAIRKAEGSPFQWIVYNEKVIPEFRLIMECRSQLHDTIYKHKTVVAFEMQYVEMLRVADNHLFFIGKNGKAFRMSEAIDDMVAYEQLDDDVFTLIRRADNDGLLQAQSLLRDLEKRQTYRLIGSITVVPQIKEEIHKEVANFFEDKMKRKRYKIRCYDLHQDLGLHNHPLEKIYHFERRGNDEVPLRHVSAQEIFAEKASGSVKILLYQTSYIHGAQLSQEFREFKDKLLKKYNASNTEKLQASNQKNAVVWNLNNTRKR